MISVSKKFSPTAATLATTSPGAATGSGISASTRSSGAPKRWQRMAFTGARSLERCRHAIARTTVVEGQGGRESYYVLRCLFMAGAEGVFHFPYPWRTPQSGSCFWGVPRFDLRQPKGGGAGARDEVCDARFHPPHTAGGGRFSQKTAATTAGK